MHTDIALDTMPDGTDFISWERPADFTRTLHVNTNHPRADDANPGTAEAPLASIDAAARIVQPGERVLVHPGIYREWVRPARGGTGPEAMIHFEAAEPGAVVISASEVYDGAWLPSAGWSASRAAAGKESPALWMAALPRAWFDGYKRQINAVGIDVGVQSWLSEKAEICGHHIIRRNTVEACGICGLAGGHGIENLLVEDNIFRDCCWQDVERYFECAAIKFHLTRRALVRRNRIFDTKGGSGIWLDWDNRCSRVCRNLIVGTHSMFGGVFIEASHTANLIDHNIILDTDGNGIYSHDSDRITVAHNLIARSTKAAVFLCLGDAKRWVQGRGATSRRHRVLNNIFTDNETVVEFDNPDNHSDYNLLGRDGGKGPLRIHRPEQNLDLDAWREFHDWDTHSVRATVTVTFDHDSQTCGYAVDGALPVCPRLAEADVDYHGQPRAEGAVCLGPFDTVEENK